MTILLTILASLLVFGAVIAVHEFGHFAAAKLSGIQVNEFAIGMGPALWKKIAGGTNTPCGCCRWGAMWPWKARAAPESNQAEARPGRPAGGGGGKPHPARPAHRHPLPGGGHLRSGPLSWPPAP